MEEKTSLIEQELENKLNEVLSRLPDRCRQIFVMSRFDNKKNKEIAGELDISVKAVEKQITKALATIRTEMKDYLPLLLFLSSQLLKKWNAKGIEGNGMWLEDIAIDCHIVYFLKMGAEIFNLRFFMRD